jgi:BirA family biotin operon repressor/biotin-[acetyl-CoA-carboxylase] ligase
MDQLSAEAVASALTTWRLGRPVLVCERLGSTNDVVHERAAAGAAEGLLVLAEEQTRGRGRLNRSWWAPAGTSLLMSLLLRPPIPAHQAGQLTMCLGLAAVEGIEAVTGLRPALKWPNDLWLGGRKLGGMLTELRMDGERLEYAVLGLGLNVNLEFAERSATPSDLVATATSLLMVLGRPVDRLQLLVAILARCEAWYDRLLRGESLHRAWAAWLETVGRDVKVTTSAGVLHGRAVGVTAEGALLVQGQDGRVHTIWAGDVTSVR